MNHIATIARPARLLLVLPLSGCSLSPEIPVLGGAFLLIPCHILITRKGWQPRFSPLVFSYVALMFLFATLLWFLFFVH
ncbi:YtcA family lipoprotein [Klebsiella pneumoniae]|uniref:YtcA family lipoprotein n=1 Tax=Klebsiella pneumoniae TaxID=573 RepID=UPI000E2BFBA6|nr:YtcA family lipoprotein [Klebsiella pneumoniae]SXL17254.1 Uncharacterised protein [Klebsiella pneumoniae]